MQHHTPIFIEMGGLHGLAYALRTDTQGGLRDDERDTEYAKRRGLYLSNEYPLPHVRPFYVHMLENFQDPMLQVLVVAGIISIAAGSYQHPSTGWIEGLAILICVAVVVLVAAYNNHKQETSYRDLVASLKGSSVSVVRGGKQISMDQDLLLVGDLVFLNPGSMIPADGVIADQTTVRVNESSITGESDEKVKNLTSDSFLSAGTELVEGSCSMLVTATGINSAKGKIMLSLSSSQAFTKLQMRLAEVAKLAAYIGFTCGSAALIALLIKFFAEKPDYSSEWVRIIDIFIICITIVIVAVPEGLPLAVTVSMAYSMNRMRQDQNLVKVMSACETMGNATTICSDKTGTLTQNKMTVVQTFVGGEYFARQPRRAEVSPALHNLLVEGIVLNSDRRVAPENMKFDAPPEDWRWEGDGGATEAALLSWLSRYHDPSVPQPEGKNRKPRNIMQLRVDNRMRTIKFYPFSSAKKYSSVVIADGATSVESLPPIGRRYYKGAADRVIAKCTSMLDAEGNVCAIPGGGGLDLQQKPGPGVAGTCQFSLSGEQCNRWALLGRKDSGLPVCCTDPAHRPEGVMADELVLVDQHPMKHMENMARVGLRCIAFAYVDDVPLELKDGQLADPVDDGLPWTLIGLVGIKDPLRLETRDAVMTVQQAGLVVRMVTGDNLDTARFIAKDCGIISHPRQVALEGVQFRQRLEQNEANKARTGEDLPEFVELVKNLRVMARCQPEDKLELVKFLREHGEVVGVTGDGSNDGPALKAADVGLAMNIAGTDVAKAAADIIILDDNFSSIVKSVMWGRSVFDNIRKFLQFQCSVNFCALVIALIGAIGLGKEPLKPIQLLWVNLVMDTMGALAIGTEIPKPTLLLRRPYRPDSPLVSRIMWRNIVGQALFQLVILLTLLFNGENWFPEHTKYWALDDAGVMRHYTNEGMHYTFLFNTFVWLQLFNEINSRKCNDEINVFVGILDNAWFVSIFIISCGCQAIMVELLGSFAQTTPQPWSMWLVAIALGFSQLVTGLLLRFWAPDVTEGQIDLDPNTFENAAWKADPSLLGAMFKTYAAKRDDDDDDDDDDDGGAAATAKAGSASPRSKAYAGQRHDAAGAGSGDVELALAGPGGSNNSSGVSSKVGNVYIGNAFARAAAVCEPAAAVAAAGAAAATAGFVLGPGAPAQSQFVQARDARLSAAPVIVLPGAKPGVARAHSGGHGHGNGGNASPVSPSSGSGSGSAAGGLTPGGSAATAAAGPIAEEGEDEEEDDAAGVPM